MLGITASKVPETLAYFSWKENVIRLPYAVGNINNFLALHIIIIYLC